LATFLEFFEGDLESGTLTFTAIDPRTEESTEYEFVEAPTWRDVAPGYWRLQFALRKINLPPVT